VSFGGLFVVVVWIVVLVVFVFYVGNFVFYVLFGCGFFLGCFKLFDEFDEKDFCCSGLCFIGENLDVNLKLVVKVVDIVEEKDIMFV